MKIRYWVTFDDKKIAITQLEDWQLWNAIRFLENSAKAYYYAEIANYERMMVDLTDATAFDWCKQRISELCDEDWNKPRNEVYEYLIDEAIERQLLPIDYWYGMDPKPKFRKRGGEEKLLDKIFNRKKR